MLVKTIILSKFHTSKTIHNHSGKTADISTVLKSTQYHNLITRHSGYSKYMVLPPVLLWKHLPAVGTLVQPAFEIPKVQYKFLCEGK